MDKLYTLEEARTYLRISDSTIRRYIRAGKLKATMIGRQYRIKDTDIQRFVEQEEQKKDGEHDE